MDNKKKEFTLHLPDTYDYRFISDKREIIIKVLQQSYADIAKKNLAIYDIPEKNLKGFTKPKKTRREMLKDIHLQTSETLQLIS